MLNLPFLRSTPLCHWAETSFNRPPHFSNKSAVFSTYYGFRKPDPRLFHIALAALNAPASKAIYIGNSYETDLIRAREAGLALVGPIRLNEETSKNQGHEYKPDFVGTDLRDALTPVVKFEHDGADATV